VHDERGERLGPDVREPELAVAAAMNCRRSSIANSGAFLRTEEFTTATTTSSNSSAARAITSRWPFVIGS
jgi:hypothetical protein